MESEAIAKVDNELLRQLDDEGTSSEPIVAVVRLHSDDPSQIVPVPEQTEKIAQEVLERVHRRVGGGETRHNIFKNLGYFVVSADKPFLRELISQPEVANAVANVQPGSTFIPPVKKRAVRPIRQKANSAGGKKGRSRVATRKTAGKSVK
ncbi:MAG: hypothetical protein ACJ741_14150 [Pyrinomonadaceae bacterium]